MAATGAAGTLAHVAGERPPGHGHGEREPHGDDESAKPAKIPPNRGPGESPSFPRRPSSWRSQPPGGSRGRARPVRSPGHHVTTASVRSGGRGGATRKDAAAEVGLNGRSVKTER